MDFDKFEEHENVSLPRGVMVDFEKVKEIKEAVENGEVEKIDDMRSEVINTDDFVPDTEPIFAVVEEEFSKYSSDEIKSKAMDLKNKIESGYWELCKCLYYINKKQLYLSWGHSTFNDYVTRELNFQKSKARYLIQIWEALYVNQPDKVVFDKVMSVGWSKAKELIHVVTSSNVDEWVSKAQNMSVEDLKKEVKRYLDKLMPKDDEKTVLENVENVEGTPAEQATRTVSFTFTYQEFVTISEVLDSVKSSGMVNSALGNGAIFALIAAEYLATNPREEKMPGRDYVIQALRKYENLHNIDVIAIDRETKEFIYGEDNVPSSCSCKDGDCVNYEGDTADNEDDLKKEEVFEEKDDTDFLFQD